MFTSGRLPIDVVAVVPAGIRAGPNPQIFFFVFLERWYSHLSATRRRGREFLEFLSFKLSFFSFVVCFPWVLVSGRGVLL